MALLFIKSMIFPQSRNDGGRSSLLQPHFCNHYDLESASHSYNSQTTSNLTITIDASNEKTPASGADATRPSSPARITPRMIADATIGLSDGLTVPFALTAGLSALGDTKVVIYGGLAELIAGSISMGLGGYLGARSEAEAYQNALAETKAVVRQDGKRAGEMVQQAFDGYVLPNEALESIAHSLRRDEKQLVNFLMAFYYRLVETDYAPSRAYIAGLTISAGYFLGGLVPLLPYLVFARIDDAFMGSTVVMAVTLFAFGWVKTSLVGEKQSLTCCKNGLQMIIMGGVAAGASMGCVKAVGGG